MGVNWRSVFCLTNYICKCMYFDRLFIAFDRIFWVFDRNTSAFDRIVPVFDGTFLAFDRIPVKNSTCLTELFLCLTEHFWCLTEILSRARFVWQNIPKMFKNHKSLLISGMNQYFEKSPWQKLQNHISQLLSGGFFDWSLSLGDQFKKLFLHFA